MTDIQKALLGDKDAAQILTEQGVSIPCPSCKSENIKYCYACGEYWLECSDCGTACGFKNTLGEAIKSWNTRAPILTLKQMKRLEEING